mmetsp:Transcript_61248/g.124887  ORF Transcript_61248/g.124887 Transcript_61248/m.124887 type:complete len:225 (+) Transcript_61248:206-880(+)
MEAVETWAIRVRGGRVLPRALPPGRDSLLHCHAIHGEMVPCRTLRLAVGVARMDEGAIALLAPDACLHGLVEVFHVRVHRIHLRRIARLGVKAAMLPARGSRAEPISFNILLGESGHQLRSVDAACLPRVKGRVEREDRCCRVSISHFSEIALPSILLLHSTDAGIIEAVCRVGQVENIFHLRRVHGLALDSVMQEEEAANGCRAELLQRRRDSLDLPVDVVCV